MIFQILLLIIISALLISVAWTLFSLAPFFPTRQRDYQRIENLANLQEGEKFIDLGCGFGGLLKHLSRKHSNIYGVELNMLIYLSTLVLNIFSPPKYKLLYGNALNHNYNDYSVVYIFAASSQHFKTKLIKKLENELGPGARVITYCFPIEAWTPKLTNKPSSKDRSLFLYEL